MIKDKLNRYLFTLIAFSAFSTSAQDLTNESVNLIEDVIVTARRRELDFNKNIVISFNG